MKRRKTLIILLSILAAVCVITLIVKQIEQHVEKIQTTDEVILSIDKENVDTLSWDNENKDLAFHKDEDGVWKWDDDDAFPVDEDKINDLLSSFESFGASFVIDDVEDLSQYGLDKPVCTIALKAGDQEYNILLGDFSKMDSQRYVSIGDGKVYLVKNDPYDSFNIALNDMIKNDETPDIDTVSSLEFSGNENYKVEYQETNNYTICADDHYFTELNGETVALDSTNVENYYNKIVNLALDNYVSYNVTEDELASWGLDDPALTVTITYTATDAAKDDPEQTFTISMGQNQKELAAKQKAEDKGKDYEDEVSSYVRIGDSQIIYQISEDDYNAITTAAYNDLRHKNVFTADFDDIESIDVTLEDGTYTITSDVAKSGGEEKYDYFYNDEKIEITDFRSKLKALTITDFSDAEPTEKEEIGLVLHTSNDSFPEITIDIYRYDGSSCLVVLDGETLGLVNRASVVDLVEAVNTIVLG